MAEIHISHFDDELTATVEAHGDEALTVLRELGAEHLGHGRYRLPVERLGEFCDLRFGVERVAVRKLPITEAQKVARRESLAKVRAKRWVMEMYETQEKR